MPEARMSYSTLTWLKINTRPNTVNGLSVQGPIGTALLPVLQFQGLPVKVKDKIKPLNVDIYSDDGTLERSVSVEKMDV